MKTPYLFFLNIIVAYCLSPSAHAQLQWPFSPASDYTSSRAFLRPFGENGYFVGEKYHNLNASAVSAVETIFGGKVTKVGKPSEIGLIGVQEVHVRTPLHGFRKNGTIIYSSMVANQETARKKNIINQGINLGTFAGSNELYVIMRKQANVRLNESPFVERITHKLLKKYLCPNVIITNLSNQWVRTPDVNTGEWYTFTALHNSSAGTAYVTAGTKVMTLKQAFQRKYISNFERENSEEPGVWERRRIGVDWWYFKKGVQYRFKKLKKEIVITFNAASDTFHQDQAILDCLHTLSRPEFRNRYSELHTGNMVLQENNVMRWWSMTYATKKKGANGTPETLYIGQYSLKACPLERWVEIQRPDDPQYFINHGVHPDFLN